MYIAANRKFKAPSIVMHKPFGKFAEIFAHKHFAVFLAQASSDIALVTATVDCKPTIDLNSSLRPNTDE
jgi:hypothetical protein